MNRRTTLRTIGGIGFASILGVGATGTTGASHAQPRTNNSGRVATYNGRTSKVTPTLGGFETVLLYLANPGPSPAGTVTPVWFQEEIMGRSREDIVTDRNAGIDFLEDTYGVEFDHADEDDVFEETTSTGDIDATFQPNVLNPGAGYTAYLISGRSMPNTHGDDHTNTDPEATGKVRDGGWVAVLNEESQLGGSYGDDIDLTFPEGTRLLWGDYNIRMGDQEDPIVIHYDSAHPVDFSGPIPSAFNCRVEHEDWGEGAVRGVTQGDMIGIRNVLTFPASL